MTRQEICSFARLPCNVRDAFRCLAKLPNDIDVGNVLVHSYEKMEFRHAQEIPPIRECL